MTHGAPLAQCPTNHGNTSDTSHEPAFPGHVVTCRQISPKPRISFFCPAYHDEENLARVVRRGCRALESAATEYEWIIIDDASPDRTGTVADDLAASLARVRAIHNTDNLGHGGALKRGFATASLDWVGFCDGDDQYDPRDITKFLPHIQDAHIIIGRRIAYPNGTRRKLLSIVFNIILRGLFNAPFHDLGCSFKLFRKDVLPLVDARSPGIFTQCEMVLRGHRRGLRIAEVDIPAYPRTSGRSSSVTMKNIYLLARDVLSLFREFYF